MAELTAREKLQPALLDRLTDTHPERKVEARSERVIGDTQLRAAVLRDLAWLFNTAYLGAQTDLSALPEVEKSVLNYGLPPLSGRMVSGFDIAGLEQAIKHAIQNFEPRILPESLRVRAIATASALEHHNVLGFTIEGRLWAQPLPLELYLKTEVDLETGEVSITALED